MEWDVNFKSDGDLLLHARRRDVEDINESRRVMSSASAIATAYARRS